MHTNTKKREIRGLQRSIEVRENIREGQRWEKEKGMGGRGGRELTVKGALLSNTLVRLNCPESFSLCVDEMVDGVRRRRRDRDLLFQRA